MIWLSRKYDYPLPQWGLRWLTPELHQADSRHLETSLLHIGEFHDQLEGETMPGFALYEYLNQTNLLMHCLNIPDGMSFMQQPSILRLPYFSGTRILLWKSTMLGGCRNLFVPFIQVIRRQAPVIYWWWLEYPVHLRLHKGLILTVWFQLLPSPPSMRWISRAHFFCAYNARSVKCLVS